MELKVQQKQLIVNYINGTGINHYNFDKEESSHKTELKQFVSDDLEDDLYNSANDFAMDYLFCKNADIFKSDHGIK